MSTDDARFEALFAKYGKRLAGRLRAAGWPEQEAEDAAQEGLIETWKRLDTIAPGAEWAYMLTAARSRASNAQRKLATKKRSDKDVSPKDLEPPPPPSAEAALIEEQERAAFNAAFLAAFGELPLETQLCITLRRRGFSNNEVAEKLDTTMLSVQSRLKRAAKHFRERIANPPRGLDWLDQTGDDDDDAE
ncbi:MAG TPA: RNA polymerase sigma factor [Thermoanaerobaculia bacterium]|jgi:RNA polymerase sigma-70 factor (ECF subfamily)